MELFDFYLTPEHGVDDCGQAYVMYAYAMSVHLDELSADLEGIMIARLYQSPVAFVAEDFHAQQAAIAQQLATQFSEQGDLPPLVVEEASCVLCYAALWFALTERINTFWQHPRTTPLHARRGGYLMPLAFPFAADCCCPNAYS